VARRTGDGEGLTGARVAWISYTPVKGLGLLGADEAELTLAGIPGDRRFHLIDAKGHLTNGKRVGLLQQVRASWDEQTRRLALHFPDGSTVAEEVTPDGEPVTTSFYGRAVDGARVAGSFSAALSEFTGTELVLVQPAEPGAGVDRGSDGAVTLLSEAALGTLAGAAQVDELDARRFRMNFGVAGVEAHAEDGWVGRRVQIGDAIVVPRGHVGRCLITSRHPETGKIDVDTLEALATYRRSLDTTEELSFGVYAAVEQPGRVRVGDPVVVG
jgi:uncharacterized protein